MTATSNRRSHGEGSIFFEAARNRWVGTVDLGLDGTGKRRRAKVTGRTKSQARDKLRAVQRQAEAGLPIGDGGLTFGAFLDRWLAEVLPARPRVQSSNTLDNYRWAVERHLRPALGAKRLRALTPEDVEALLRHLAADGMAQNSVMRVRSVAVMALKHAQRRDLVARNAAELAEMPAGARAADEGRFLTVDQAARLLTVAEDDPLGPLVVVGLMLGLRPGELCGLRWSDVDLEGRTLHVRAGSEAREGIRWPRGSSLRRTQDAEVPAVARHAGAGGHGPTAPARPAGPGAPRRRLRLARPRPRFRQWHRGAARPVQPAAGVRPADRTRGPRPLAPERAAALRVLAPVGRGCAA